jgi:hypothetical protein
VSSKHTLFKKQRKKRKELVRQRVIAEPGKMKLWGSSE